MAKRNSRSKAPDNTTERFKGVIAKNDEQENMLRAIKDNIITLVKGFPGSGKTFLAVGCALQGLFNKEYKQIVFTRPVVEAGGEKLGFLPGTMYEKINPYMLPIFNSLSKFLPQELADKVIYKSGNVNGNGDRSNGDLPIKVLPLAFMRGVTLDRSFIVGDEMQNANPEQIRMLLTRIGRRSKMVLCGDVYQSDIRTKNGLADAFEILEGVKNIGLVTMNKNSIVRHPIIQEIENKYLEQQLEKQES